MAQTGFVCLVVCLLELVQVSRGTLCKFLNALVFFGQVNWKMSKTKQTVIFQTRGTSHLSYFVLVWNYEPTFFIIYAY